MQPLRYFRCLGQRDSEGPTVPGVSDFVLYTMLGLTPGTHFEDQTPFDQGLQNGITIDTCVENFYGVVLKSLVESTTRVALVTTHGLSYRSSFRMRYASSTGCGGSGRSPRTPL